MVAVVNPRIGKDLAAVAAQLRGDLFARWMGLAQKRALLAWRNKTTCPGLAARFTKSAIAYYNWLPRLSPKRYDRYFVNGGFRNQLMARKPKTDRASLSSGMVITRFAMGGGVLNFLDRDNTRPVVSSVRGSKDVRYAVHGFTRSIGKGTVQVRAYMSHHTVRTNTKTKGDVTYAQAWKRSFGAADKSWLERATAMEFRRIVRGMAYDRRTGRIKSSVVSASEEAI